MYFFYLKKRGGGREQSEQSYSNRSWTGTCEGIKTNKDLESLVLLSCLFAWQFDGNAAVSQRVSQNQGQLSSSPAITLAEQIRLKWAFTERCSWSYKCRTHLYFGYLAGEDLSVSKQIYISQTLSLRMLKGGFYIKLERGECPSLACFFRL